MASSYSYAIHFLTNIYIFSFSLSVSVSVSLSPSLSLSLSLSASLTVSSHHSSFAIIYSRFSLSSAPSHTELIHTSGQQQHTRAHSRTRTRSSGVKQHLHFLRSTVQYISCIPPHNTPLGHTRQTRSEERR